jgi:D-alanine-D-alanine ligase
MDKEDGMKVVVLAGGLSVERDVSLSTGCMIYRALTGRGHQCVLVDIYLGLSEDVKGIFERDKDWAVGLSDVKEEEPDLELVREKRKGDKDAFFGPGVLEVCLEADVVFLALHGAEGENGKLQACFDLMGIRYTGTDYISSAMAMDKELAKDIFRAYGIPTPEGYRLGIGEEDVEGKMIPFPRVVKVNSGGSSIGVYITYSEKEYEQAKQDAFSYEKEVLIEQYIGGREFDVGILDGNALPVIEIAPLSGFYDYKSKYQKGLAVETCPADISAKKTEEMQRLAEKVFRVLRMKGYGRIDFKMEDDGRIYCLEANSLPGMTPTSLLPQEAAATGMSFEALCEEIIRISLRDARMDK